MISTGMLQPNHRVDPADPVESSGVTIPQTLDVEGTLTTAPGWSTVRVRLLDAATRAQARAREDRLPVLVSVRIPYRNLAPFDLYAATARTSEKRLWYWERADAGDAVTGVGAAYCCEGERGSDAMSDEPVRAMRTWWRQAVARAIACDYSGIKTGDEAAGQVFGFGGLAFDVASPPTPRWGAFPAWEILAPECVVSVMRGICSLTLQLCIEPSTQPVQAIDALVSRADRYLQNASALASTKSTDTDRSHRDISLVNLLPANQWRDAVRGATAAISEGTYEKVVLARGVEARCDVPIQADDVVARLRSRFPSAYIFAIRNGATTFVGATPERLAQVERGQVRTMALAGSAPRGATEQDDKQLAQALRTSEKNVAEHGIVVDRIRQALEPLTNTLHVPEELSLLRQPNVQHLYTPILGQLKRELDVLNVVGALHPTPAVAGWPRAQAVAAIRRLEHLDRGWYAGPVGWLNGKGDGEFAVALRCALIDGNRATLFAGCGIVANSDPEAEYAESQLKLRVMLEGLGGMGEDRC